MSAFSTATARMCPVLSLRCFIFSWYPTVELQHLWMQKDWRIECCNGTPCCFCRPGTSVSQCLSDRTIVGCPALRLIKRNRAADRGNKKLLHTGCEQQIHSVDDAHVLTHLGNYLVACLQSASQNRSHLCIIA